MTPLLGPAAALSETQALLRATRCLTFVGAGGAGKTRLALALAEAVRCHYPGGVWWVGLNALSDPALLPQAVAGALGGADLVTPPLPLLTDRLAGRETLLVLDNYHGRSQMQATASSAPAVAPALPQRRRNARHRHLRRRPCRPAPHPLQ